MTDRVKGYAAGLFQIAGALRSSDELRDSLSNPQLPTDRKNAIVDGLLGSRASDLTVAFVNFVVGLGRASSLPDIVDELAETAASSVNREVAEIPTPVNLHPATLY